MLETKWRYVIYLIRMKGLRIALVGYGRMGRMIHHKAEARGHQIVLTVDSASDEAWESPLWSEVDVAIEFTQPEVAEHNVRRLLERGVAVVSGTTGWAEGLERLKQEFAEDDRATLLWASNYSIGVNLFFEINRLVARVMQGVASYRPSMTEVHHIHKLDAPSGTAITLAEGLCAQMPERLAGWSLAKEGQEPAPDRLPIVALREGEVAGIHRIEYRSQVDRIQIEHEAFGRDGFAEGAVVAGEFIAGRKGFYTMQDLLNYFLSQQA